MSTSPLWSWTVDLSQIPEASARADVQVLAALTFKGGLPTGISPTRSQIQNWIKEGRVRLNGTPLRAGVGLVDGALLEIDLPSPTPSALVPEDRPLEILYQDEHLAIVNKPPGLTVHPSNTQKDGTLVHMLLHHIRDLSGIGGELRPGIVHRIDKDTSGALVITKTDACHQKLSEVFARHEIERAYWALCYGTLAERRGTLKTRLGRSPKDRKKMAILEGESGREAITHFETLARFGERAGRAFASHVELKLETGRTHQIRVHLAHLGASVLGDRVYGAPSDRNDKWAALPAPIRAIVRDLPGQALHARTLGFKHPITGAMVRVEAPPPAVFARLKEALGAYSIAL